MNELFRKFSISVALVMGSPWAFGGACLLIAGWVITGPVFHYSETWQLVINTLTTIITFLMVFLIQNTQNRDIKTIQLKLDELLRALDTARTQMVDLEDEPDEKLALIAEEFKGLGNHPESADNGPRHSGQVPGESGKAMEKNAQHGEKGK
jgi:low affinity Fe/Cu permease